MTEIPPLNSKFPIGKDYDCYEKLLKILMEAYFPNDLILVENMLSRKNDRSEKYYRLLISKGYNFNKKSIEVQIHKDPYLEDDGTLLDPFMWIVDENGKREWFSRENIFKFLG